MKLAVFFASLAFPFAFLGVRVILWFRLGWPSLIGIVIPILIIPLQTYIGKKNSKLLIEANKPKD